MDDLTQNFYGSYFLVKPIVDPNRDDMHFQFHARVHDESLISHLIQSKTQSQLPSSQKTWLEPSMEEDYPSIKIPKVLVDSRLTGISSVILTPIDA